MLLINCGKLLTIIPLNEKGSNKENGDELLFPVALLFPAQNLIC